MPLTAQEIELFLAGLALGTVLATSGWAGLIAVSGLLPARLEDSNKRIRLKTALRVVVAVLFGFAATVCRPAVVNVKSEVLGAGALVAVALVLLPGVYFVLKRLFYLRLTQADVIDNTE